MNDSQNLSRHAQLLTVDYKKGVGSPPKYSGAWEPLWSAKVDRVEINHGVKPSVTEFWFPNYRWNEPAPVTQGDMVRITGSDAVAFVGFIVNKNFEFSGGSERPGAGFERQAFVCLDHRWLIAACSLVFGQLSRGPDDRLASYPYSGIEDQFTALPGQRAVFNAGGFANKDPVELTGGGLAPMPIFTNPGIGSSYWTARDMVRYLLHPRWKNVSDFLYISNPASLAGLSDSDWDKVLYNISVDGLNTIEAVGLICRHLAWDFRLAFGAGGGVSIEFYKFGAGDSHNLYAPDAGENISSAVESGKKMLWSMSLAQDIRSVINRPVIIGAPDRFEFTAELVPAWLDSSLSYDPDNLANLYKTEAQLQQMQYPDALSFYNNYHTRGAAFNSGALTRNVGRRWVLNEMAHYSNPQTYNRGKPFLWESVIPAQYINIHVSYNPDKVKRRYGLYARRLLPCLTVHIDGLSSIGVKVEFSFDGGLNWQVVPCSIRLLEKECGIYIAEPNLAEIVDKYERAVSGGPLNGIPINLFTSIVDDKANGRSFVRGGSVTWHTRVRVTASVQLDNRLLAIGSPSVFSGSPFNQSQLYDFSEKYGLVKRSPVSVYGAPGSPLPAVEFDSQSIANAHVEQLRKNNEDMSISGRFTLERLWLGDGSGVPEFKIGDRIAGIDGRDFELGGTFGGSKSYPEIIQIVYLPESQKQVLITRDLRYAQVNQ